MATAGDETAANGEVMYADEGPYTIDGAAMLKRWWGRLERRRMATESGGDETATRPGTRPAVPGTRPATRRRRWLVTNEAATGGVMYVDEGPYKIDVRHVEEMMGTTREAADGDRVRRGRDGDETGDETGGPRNETGDKTAAMAGDERGGDRWGNVCGRRSV